jgi:hypothetical protein
MPIDFEEQRDFQKIIGFLFKSKQITSNNKNVKERTGFI